MLAWISLHSISSFTFVIIDWVVWVLDFLLCHCLFFIHSLFLTIGFYVGGFSYVCIRLVVYNSQGHGIACTQSWPHLDAKRSIVFSVFACITLKILIRGCVLMCPHCLAASSWATQLPIIGSPNFISPMTRTLCFGQSRRTTMTSLTWRPGSHYNVSPVERSR